MNPVHRLSAARKWARAYIRKSQIKLKERFDRNRIDDKYSIGDIVLVRGPMLKKNQSQKWIEKYKGPYRITERTGPVNVRVVNTRGRPKQQVVHVERLKSYKQR